MKWIKQPRLRLEGGSHERITEIMRQAKALGWSVRLDPKEGRSTAWPFARNMKIRRWTSRPAENRVGILVHEFTHVRQWGGPWWRRWWRGLVYVFSVKARVAIEVEARAHQAVATVDYLRARGQSFERQVERIVTWGSLWGWPYLNPWGDGDEIMRQTRQRIAELGAEDVTGPPRGL